LSDVIKANGGKINQLGCTSIELNGQSLLI